MTASATIRKNCIKRESRRDPGRPDNASGDVIRPLEKRQFEEIDEVGFLPHRVIGHGVCEKINGDVVQISVEQRK